MEEVALLVALFTVVPVDGSTINTSKYIDSPFRSVELLYSILQSTLQSTLFFATRQMHRTIDNSNVDIVDALAVLRESRVDSGSTYFFSSDVQVQLLILCCHAIRITQKDWVQFETKNCFLFCFVF